MKRIENLLNREIGLSTRSIGQSAVEAAVKTRLRQSGVAGLSEYLTRLENEPGERAALVEEIVVSETWFFRDEEVFKALRRHAAGWLVGERTLRVLSRPCATGEEAYAASISLLEAGLRPARFTVRAVDISERALGQARLGLYGKNSFRGSGMAEHAGFFEPVDGGFRVVDAARSSVQFSRGNVLEATLCTPRAFDVVLCRNLLIYLDAPARARALDNLCSWLSEDGVLFSGHAEAVERMDSRFERVATLGHFAYVKRSQKQDARAAPTGQGRRSVRPRPAPGRKRAQSPPPAPVVSEAQQAAQPTLVLATELANRGELEAARRLCEELIQARPTPEAYCLLGIINNAGGDRDGAIACFNKSLYLNQAHYEALVHLALLHEQRGEQPTAANFRRRAERALRGEAK